MSQKTRDELLERLRPSYARRGLPGRKRLLDEFCELSGYNRKYAIKLLRGQRGTRKRPPGRKKTYDEDVHEVVRDIWRLSNQLCSKLLKAALPLWLPAYEKERGRLPDELRQKVLQISPAQIDRLLKGDRVKTALWRHTGNKPGAALRSTVPIRTEWKVQEPGWLEADTVAHCGGSMADSFVWSITYVDIHTGWLSLRAVYNRGQHGVYEQTRCMETHLPFPLLGFDTDNGGEFINQHVLNYLRDRKQPVEVSRSRPYRKNDNAHVEQRNRIAVRELIGYDRLEDPQAVHQLNDLYRKEWEPLCNFYRPIRKLISSEKVGSKYIKKYDKPQTPYERLLASGVLTKEKKKELDALKNALNPIELHHRLERKLKELRFS